MHLPWCLGSVINVRPGRSTPARRRRAGPADRRASLQRLNQFDRVAVRVLQEGGPGARRGLVARLRHDAVVVDPLEGGVDVVHLHGEVVVGGPLIEGVLSVGVGQLQFDPVVVGDVHVSRVAVRGGELPGALEPEVLRVPVGRLLRVGDVEADVDERHARYEYTTINNKFGDEYQLHEDGTRYENSFILPHCCSYYLFSINHHSEMSVNG